MEPLFFKAENLRPTSCTSTALCRFNGAAFFQSGKYNFCFDFPESEKCFNGAAFFQSGKFRHAVTVLLAYLSFNGAAFFQSGK